MITAVIIDDEQPARDELHYLLRKHADIEVTGEAASGTAAVELIGERAPDLVFLDIQMPGMTGFQVVQELMDRVEELPAIVFVTAYDEYAVRAFEVSAVDYLLKPVEEERLAQALDKVRKQAAATALSPEELSRLVRQMEEGERTATLPHRISVRKGDRYVLVDPNDVTHAYVVDGVVCLCTSKLNGMTTHKTLEELEKDLDGRIFWRVHRSYIVNINHVAEILPLPTGSYRLRLDDEKKTTVPLSRAQAKLLRKVVKW